MLKHVFWMILASIALIFFLKHVTWVMHQIGIIHHFFSTKLTYIFAGGKVGLLIRRTLALLLVPVAATTILGGTYYLVKKDTMPHLYTFMWILWIVMATSVSLHRL